MTGRRSGDEGTVVPFILLCFVLAALVVAGTIAASSAFLAQRDLAGVCDGAAVAAANAVSEPGVYARTDGDLGQLPLDEASVGAAIAEYHDRNYSGDPDGLSLSASTDGESVTVACRRVVPIPFGAVFGHARGLSRTAISTARAPAR